VTCAAPDADPDLRICDRVCGVWEEPGSTRMSPIAACGDSAPAIAKDSARRLPGRARGSAPPLAGPAPTLPAPQRRGRTARFRTVAPGPPRCVL